MAVPTRERRLYRALAAIALGTVLGGCGAKTDMERARNWLDDQPKTNWDDRNGLPANEAQAWAAKQEKRFQAWIADGKQMPGASACLREMLKDEAQKPCRFDIVFALGCLGDNQSIPALTEILSSKSEDASVSAAAAAGLADIAGANAIVPLGEALKDPRSFVRYRACCLLGRFSGPKVREYLLEAARDSDRATRESAKYALEKMQPPNP